MKRTKLGLGLLTAAIGLAGSAFTVKSHANVKTTDLYWYSTAGGSASKYVDQNTTANEITRLENQVGGTFSTVATGGTFFEKGFIDGGSGVQGTDPSVSLYQH